MTLQEVVELVPHGVLELVARFCEDPEIRELTVQKHDGTYKAKYGVCPRPIKTIA